MRRGREEDPAGPFRGSRRTAGGPVGQHLRARAGAKSDGSIHGAREIDQLVPDVELGVWRRPRRLPNADPASAVTNPPVASTAPPRTAERLTRSARECRRVSARSLAGADNPHPIPESVMPQILLRGLLGDARPRARAHCSYSDAIQQAASWQPAPAGHLGALRRRRSPSPGASRGTVALLAIARLA